MKIQHQQGNEQKNSGKKKKMEKHAKKKRFGTLGPHRRLFSHPGV